MEQNQQKQVQIDLNKLVGKKLLINDHGLREVILEEIAPSGKYLKLGDPEGDNRSVWKSGPTVEIVEILEGVQEAIVPEELETEEIEA